MTLIAPAFIGGVPGGPEMLVIAGIAVLLFGANKIPKLARSLGESAGEFKKGRQELESELDDVQSDIEDAAEPVQEASNPRSEAE